MNRIIVLIDMDCFYAQVEQKLNPEIQGKPCAVVQYKKWKGGSIIAVNYEARKFGVNRSMHGDDAKRVCPEIYLPRVPELRGKADLTRYREASKKVFDVLTQFSDNVERASIDEAYIDLTEEVQKRISEDLRIISSNLSTTHVIGFEEENSEESDGKRRNGVERWLKEIYDESIPKNDDQRLAIAAELVEKIRDQVYQQTSFHCSAGIAHNKMLAKLVCGINKPKKQTVIPQSSVEGLFANTPLKKIRNLGGKLGESLTEDLSCVTMGDICKLDKQQLQNKYGYKTGSWLYDLARGIENEPVIPRQLPKSIGCSKNFFGKAALAKKSQVQHWVTQLSTEVVERINKDFDDNKRVAKLLTVSVRFGGENRIYVTRSCSITTYDTMRISRDVFSLLEKLNTASEENWYPPIGSLGLAASKFQDQVYSNSVNIKSYFQKSSDEVKQDENNIVIKTSTCDSSLKKSSLNSKKGFFTSKMESSNMRTVLEESDSIRDEKSSRNFNNETEGFDKIDGRKISYFNVENCESEDSSEKKISFDKKNGLKKNGIEKFFVNSCEKKENSVKASLEPDHLENILDVNGLKKNGIEKFFVNNFEKKENMVKPSSESDQSENILDVTECNDSSSNTHRCEICGNSIFIWDVQEHEDYHLALKVQNEWRKSENELQVKSCNKRGKNKNHNIQQSNKKMRKLETFFTCVNEDT